MALSISIGMLSLRPSANRSRARGLAGGSLMGRLRADAERLADLRPGSSLPAGDLDQFVQGGLVVGEIAFRGRDLNAQPAFRMCPIPPSDRDVRHKHHMRETFVTATASLTVPTHRKDAPP